MNAKKLIMTAIFMMIWIVCLPICFSKSICGPTSESSAGEGTDMTEINCEEQKDDSAIAESKDSRSAWSAWILPLVLIIVAIVLTIITFGGGLVIFGTLITSGSILGSFLAGTLVNSLIIISSAYMAYSGFTALKDVEKTIVFTAVCDGEITIKKEEGDGKNQKCTFIDTSSQQTKEAGDGETYSVTAGQTYSLTASAEFKMFGTKAECKCTASGKITTNNQKEDDAAPELPTELPLADSALSEFPGLVCCKTKDGICLDNYVESLCQGKVFCKSCNEIKECNNITAQTGQLGQPAVVNLSTLTGDGVFQMTDTEGNPVTYLREGKKLLITYYVPAADNRTRVIAHINKDSEEIDAIELFDDGNHNDSSKFDKYYANIWDSTGILEGDKSAKITWDIEVMYYGACNSDKIEVSADIPASVQLPTGNVADAGLGTCLRGTPEMLKSKWGLMQNYDDLTTDQIISLVDNYNLGVLYLNQGGSTLDLKRLKERGLILIAMSYGGLHDTWAKRLASSPYVDGLAYDLEYDTNTNKINPTQADWLSDVKLFSQRAHENGKFFAVTSRLNMDYDISEIRNAVATYADVVLPFDYYDPSLNVFLDIKNKLNGYFPNKLIFPVGGYGNGNVAPSKEATLPNVLRSGDYSSFGKHLAIFGSRDFLSCAGVVPGCSGGNWGFAELRYRQDYLNLLNNLKSKYRADVTRCTTSSIPPIACGNGIVEQGEECDDSNVVDGDGCSSLCKTESSPLPTSLPQTSGDMSLIPAGTFQMGDNFGDICVADSNWCQPVHSVTLDSFYMDKYEVTKELWDKVVAWGNQHGYDFSFTYGTSFTVSYTGGANYPVHKMAWLTALKWANARSEMEGLTPVYYTDSSKTSVLKTGSQLGYVNANVDWNANGYRLPTEAEWEYAARGGLVGKRFTWGDTVDLTKANICNNGRACENSGIIPKQVGSYPPNGYGLYDMAGNVAEWNWDCYGSYSSSSQNNPIALDASQAGDGVPGHCWRIVRGGAASWSIGYAENAYRFRQWSEWGYSHGEPTGFRTVRNYDANAPSADIPGPSINSYVGAGRIAAYNFSNADCMIKTVKKENVGSILIISEDADCEPMAYFNANSTLDIMFASNKYSSFDEFSQDADEAAVKMLITEPFAAQIASKGINFYKISNLFNTDDLNQIKSYVYTSCDYSNIQRKLAIVLNKDFVECSQSGFTVQLNSMFTFNISKIANKIVNEIISDFCSYINQLGFMNPPVAKILTPNQTAVLGNISIEFTIDDEEYPVDYNLQLNYIPLIYSAVDDNLVHRHVLDLPKGYWVIQVEATDIRGNSGYSNEITINTDNETFIVDLSPIDPLIIPANGSETINLNDYVINARGDSIVEWLHDPVFSTCISFDPIDVIRDGIVTLKHIKESRCQETITFEAVSSDNKRASSIILVRAG